MTTSTIYGYPRIGPRRELKAATEAYWAGRASAEELEATGRTLRRDAWSFLRDAGLGEVPSNHFSFYDHVLDTIALVGAVPERFAAGRGGELDRLFAMARGSADAQPLEMTKWFDTNYHYLVPELGPGTRFRLHPAKPLAELAEAAELGLATRPVLLGPVTFLLLGKPAPGVPAGFDRLSLLDPLLEVYAELLAALRAAGADWVQLDEPAFVLDRGGVPEAREAGVLPEAREAGGMPEARQASAELDALGRAYGRLGRLQQRPKLLVASYFDHLGDALGVLAGTPVDGLALDFTRGGGRNLELLAAAGGLGDRRLVAGVVDGRNVWVNDLERSLGLLATLLGLAGEVVVAPSCSLQHVPLDVEAETGLNPALRPWLAFARQKVAEVVTLARGLAQGREAVELELDANQRVLAERRASGLVVDPAVRERLARTDEHHARRASPHSVRHKAQRARLDLPPLPTTTIGSFPQTPDLRKVRAAARRGALDQAAYQARMEQEIDAVIRLQEQLGLDVLVHGEPERNDMVQYFGEQLAGFATTEYGWVQSYGTRYVRPPIIFGDVSRPRPITVEWSRYAQSRTSRPVKGMLTGPVTMVKWSFARDDQPLAETTRQVALAVRDEVADLEAAGIGIIQVDEPAIREGLPLRREHRAAYLAWAVEAFRLATGVVRDETQIHTHMCYSEFGDILPALSALDADVATVEAARSGMTLVADLQGAGYEQEIGLGVYDIHSPQVPRTADMCALIERALGVLDPTQVWVNPDCGLKTRGYDEVTAALRNLVEAARTVRAQLDDQPKSMLE